MSDTEEINKNTKYGRVFRLAKDANGLKEIRGVYAKISLHKQLKDELRERVKQLMDEK